MKPIATPRLVLRPIVREDAAFVLELLNDPAFLHYIGDRGVRSLGDARSYIEQGPVASYARHGFGMYIAALASTGEPVGMSGLVKRDYLDCVDVGFAFRADARSQGLAFESAAAVMEHARTDCGLTELAGIVRPDNHASIRVLTKLGMTFERMLRPPGPGPECCLYSRTL